MHQRVSGSGVGKVLLAHAPDDVVDAVLAHLTHVTPYSITQPRRLREQLADVLREGWATTLEDMTLGACSVAVPIRAGAEGPVVAALGIVVQSLKRGRPRLLTGLQVAAQGINRSLG